MITPDTLTGLLLGKVGGIESFSRNWSWRSHSPRQRATDAVSSAVASLASSVAILKAKSATDEQIDEWLNSAVQKWLVYQAAGARTANPMVTGPAKFPVERNRKAMDVERKRGEDWYHFVDSPAAWLNRRERRLAKAALSEQAANVDHRSIAFDGVHLVQNTTLDRIQLKFAGKPDASTISLLKSAAFRWSPREGAWQRQNTNNGVQAAYRVLRALGHGAEAAA